MRKYRYHKNHKYHKNTDISNKSKSSSQSNTKSFAKMLLVMNFVPIFAKGLARVIHVFIGTILIWGIRRLFEQDLQIILEFLSSLFYKCIGYEVEDANI